MRRLLLAFALLLASSAACELFFPFDVSDGGGVDAASTEASADVQVSDVHEDAPDAAVDGSGGASTLYSFVGRGIALAVDDTGLYWVLSRNNIQDVMLTNRFDGGTVVLFTDAGVNASSIVLDATHVYWLTSTSLTYGSYAGPGSVVTVAKDGGGYAVLVSKPDWWPNHLAVDDDSIYVINPNCNTEPLVLRVPKDGGAPVTLEPPTTYEYYPESIAVDDASVYRVHDSVLVSYPKDCSIDASPCVPKPLMIENAYPLCVHDIAVDDTGLYWVQASGSPPCVYGCGIYQTPKAGGSSMDAATNLFPSSSACGKSVALDTTSAYSIGTSTYEIMAGAKNGEGGAFITPSQPNPLNAPVVSDGTAIYWIDDYGTGNGHILKLAR